MTSIFLESYVTGHTAALTLKSGSENCRQNVRTIRDFFSPLLYIEVHTVRDRHHPEGWAWLRGMPFPKSETAQSFCALHKKDFHFQSAYKTVSLTVYLDVLLCKNRDWPFRSASLLASVSVSLVSLGWQSSSSRPSSHTSKGLNSISASSKIGSLEAFCYYEGKRKKKKNTFENLAHISLKAISVLKPVQDSQVFPFISIMVSAWNHLEWQKCPRWVKGARLLVCILQTPLWQAVPLIFKAATAWPWPPVATLVFSCIKWETATLVWVFPPPCWPRPIWRDKINTKKTLENNEKTILLMIYFNFMQMFSSNTFACASEMQFKIKNQWWRITHLTLSTLCWLVLYRSSKLLTAKLTKRPWYRKRWSWRIQLNSTLCAIMNTKNQPAVWLWNKKLFSQTGSGSHHKYIYLW